MNAGFTLPVEEIRPSICKTIWTNIISTPSPPECLAVVIVGGKFKAIGGASRGTILAISL
jgi:hypothetical protein